MATYSSTKAGNWSDSTVWGGTPTTGDILNIAHDIVYDLNDATTLIETININVNGILRHAATTTTLYAYRIIINGGTYDQGPDSTLIIDNRADNSTGGYLLQNTVGTSNMYLYGDIANPQTTATAAIAVGDSYVTVADVTGFGLGDHATVYLDNTIWTNYGDEGFTVNYVDTINKRLYMRQRVCPHETLTEASSTSNNYLVVLDARKYRVGQKLILDNTPDVYTISSIDTSTNRLYLTGNVTAARAIGTIVYQTGFEYVHAIGDNVYKICTHTTVQSNSGTNTITVSDIGSIVTGDILILEGGNASRSGDQYRSEKVAVSSVLGNVVTLTANLTYTHEAGLMVVKANRNCVVKGDAAWGACVMVQSTGTATRKCKMHNVWFDTLGNAYTTDWRGVNLRGTYNTSGGYASVNGCSFINFRNSDWSGMMIYTTNYVAPVRNCVTWQTHSGISMTDAGQQSFYNNIAVDSYAYGIRHNGNYDYSQDCYNIATNADQFAYYGNGIYRSRAKTTMNNDYRSNIYEHNIMRYSRDPILMSGYTVPFTMGAAKRWSFFNCYYQPQYAEAYDIFFYETENYNHYTSTVVDRGYAYADSNWGMPIAAGVNIIDVNFIPNKHIEFSYRTMMETDEIVTYNGKPSIKIQCSNNGYMSAIATRFWLPIGSTAKVSCMLRKNSAYNHATMPGIRVQGSAYYQLSYAYMENINDQWVNVTYEIPAQNNSEFIYVMYTGWMNTGAWWLGDASITVDSNPVIMPFINTFVKTPTANHLQGQGIRLQGTTLR